MKNIIFILLAATLAGCMTDPERRLSAMTPPVTVAAIDDKCNVLLVDSLGDVLQLSHTRYMADAICGSHSAGDQLIPAVSQ